MDLLVMVSIDFVLIFLAKYTNAVLQPTITVHRETADYPCNRNGATCPVGYYCFEECRKCYPCPDVNTYRVPNNQLIVMEQCVKQGQCPNLCSYMYLEPHQQANQSFCIGALLGTQEPVCELQSCDNGGTLDTSACQCSCSANWNGPTCSDCGLSCVNGGTLDEATCECRCDKDWTGSNCTDCGLTFCENGGTIDPASCQCLCNGDSCSECGLKSCQNGGTLNPTSCQCSCSEDWTGHNCSESRIKGGIPPTQTDVNGETYVLVIVLGGIVVVFVGVFLITKLLPRFECNLKPRSASDVEGALIEYVGDMEAECPTPQSIKVRAMNPNQKLKGKKMKFFCQNADDSQDPVQKWSDAMIWDSALQHLFEGLCPGVKYTILLHQYQDSLKEVNKVEATTPYYPLSVKVSGTAVTIRGLQELGINAVQGCLCMMLPTYGCKKWIIVPRGKDELVISDIPPGFDYCVKAGSVDSEQLSSQQKFTCIAEGKLRVGVPEITHDQSRSHCATFEQVLESVELRRALQVELESRKNPYLAEMVAEALRLDGDDYIRIKDARNDHVEKLDQILNRRENDTQVHDLIERLLLKERNETETTQRKEAEDFLIKLVGHTWTDFHCHECIRLLHQGHSV